MIFRCCMLYLPCIVISLSLTSLYRKTEKYPGPTLDVETQPLDSNKVYWKRNLYESLVTAFYSGEIVDEVTDEATAGRTIITTDRREPLAELCLHYLERSGLTADTGIADQNNLQDTAATPASIWVKGLLLQLPETTRETDLLHIILPRDELLVPFHTTYFQFLCGIRCLLNVYTNIIQYCTSYWSTINS